MNMGISPTYRIHCSMPWSLSINLKHWCVFCQNTNMCHTVESAWRLQQPHWICYSDRIQEV